MKTRRHFPSTRNSDKMQKTRTAVINGLSKKRYNCLLCESYKITAVLKNVKDDTLEFSTVIKELQVFLEPVFEAILHEEEWQKVWHSKESDWHS